MHVVKLVGAEISFSPPVGFIGRFLVKLVIGWALSTSLLNPRSSSRRET